MKYLLSEWDLSFQNTKILSRPRQNCCLLLCLRFESLTNLSGHVLFIQLCGIPEPGLFCLTGNKPNTELSRFGKAAKQGDWWVCLTPTSPKQWLRDAFIIAQREVSNEHYIQQKRNIPLTWGRQLPMPSEWNFSSLLLYISSWSDSWLLSFGHSLLLSLCSHLPNSWQLSGNPVCPSVCVTTLCPSVCDSVLNISCIAFLLPTHQPLLPVQNAVAPISMHWSLQAERTTFSFWGLYCLICPSLGGTVTVMGLCFHDVVTHLTPRFCEGGPCLTYLSTVIAVHSDDHRWVAQSLYVK